MIESKKPDITIEKAMDLGLKEVSKIKYQYFRNATLYVDRELTVNIKSKSDVDKLKNTYLDFLPKQLERISMLKTKLESTKFT